MTVADETFDVVVIGSGAAGMATALVARASGLSVVVLEKAAWFGGSTAVSGGAVWIPGNPFMEPMGIADSRDQVMNYLRAIVGNHMRPDMMEAYLDQGPAMVRFMETRTDVHFIPRAVSPDYEPEREGAAQGGRTIDPAPFDGRELGPMFDALRPPYASFLAFGGMMVNRKDIDSLLTLHRSPSAFRHSMGLLGRYAKDRLGWRRGTRLLMGNALAGRLLKSAISAGVALRRGVEVERLERHDDRVSAVRLKDGSVIQAKAGVVLATGGFPQNARLRAEHLPHAGVHRSMSPAANTGDGIALATALGGHVRTDNAGAAFWAPVSVLRNADGSETVFPHLIMDRQKPGIVAVNAAGRRFVNEATSYHRFVEGMHRAHEETNCIPAWLICDRKFLGRYGMGLVRPGPRSLTPFIKAGYLVEAPDIATLARRIGVPADALADTVQRVNAAGRSGIDPEFNRGASAYDRYLGDPLHRPNPCLGEIKVAPFYAVQVWPGDIGTAAGLDTDAEAHVLDANAAPIPGLYAVGNDMNSVMAGTYPAAGITLGPALTFGYIAGRAVAREAGLVPVEV